MAEVQAPSLPVATTALTTDKALGVINGVVKQVPFSLHPISTAATAALATKTDDLRVQQLISQAAVQQPLSARRIQIDENDYTLTLADLVNSSPSTPTWVIFNSATPRTLFIPPNSTTPRHLLASTFVVQAGVGAVTIAKVPGSSVVIDSFKGPTTAGRGAVVQLVETQTDHISATGDLIVSGAPVLVTPNSVNISPVQGATLTLTASVVQPNTGTVTRQWLREDIATGGLTNVGAGATTYATVVGDIGFYVWCRETITLTGFAPLVVNSNKQLIVATGVSTPQLGTQPTFLPGSSNVVGGVITVDAGDWTNSPTSYDFQRKKNGVNDGSLTNQAGRTLNYTLQAGDAGSTITYTTVGLNGSGASTQTGLTSPGIAVASGGIPTLSVQPFITVVGGGAPNVGVTLNCDPGGWANNPTSFEYKWKFVEEANPAVNGYIVPPQTAEDYVTTASDANPASRINCEVTAINATGRSDAFGLKIVAIGPVILGGSGGGGGDPIPDATAGPRFATVASGPITVSANNQTIERLRITTTPGIIVLPGVVGTIIQDCDIDGGTATGIQDQGTNTIIRHCNVDSCGRGILSHSASNCEYYKNTLPGFYSSAFPEGHAVDVQYGNGINFHDNVITGTGYTTDAVSFFMASFCRIVDNYFSVSMSTTPPNNNGAAFTMGDMIPIAEGGSGDPGHDNYASGNEVYQTNGVPAGVFGSSGNTVLEGNCFTAGIQAYDYSGVFIGVSVRNNYIDQGASYVRDSTVIAGWETNIDLGSSNVCPGF